MRRILSIVALACTALLTIGVVAASASETHSYTFAGQSSADSSTCGNDWANDTYTRAFKVYSQPSTSSTYRVVENFKNGHFVTVQAMSPGACEGGPNNGNLVSAGIHGSFHGSYILVVSGGTFSQTGASSWDATGGTAGFIAAAFGGAATYNTEDFYFNYKTSNILACDNTWTNASTGNGGDIASFCS